MFFRKRLTQGEKNVLIARAIREARYEARINGMDSSLMIPFDRIDGSSLSRIVSRGSVTVLQADLGSIYKREFYKTLSEVL